jgi:hypothetical protein
MVIPVGDERQQILHVLIKGPAGVRTERYDACLFVKLIGQEGWEDGPSEVS